MSSPIELINVDYVAGLESVSVPSAQRIVAFVAPPWGHAFDTARHAWLDSRSIEPDSRRERADVTCPGYDHANVTAGQGPCVRYAPGGYLARRSSSRWLAGVPPFTQSRSETHPAPCLTPAPVITSRAAHPRQEYLTQAVGPERIRDGWALTPGGRRRTRTHRGRSALSGGSGGSRTNRGDDRVTPGRHATPLTPLALSTGARRGWG
jgi:hypothetical protein